MMWSGNRVALHVDGQPQAIIDRVRVTAVMPMELWRAPAPPAWLSGTLSAQPAPPSDQVLEGKADESPKAVPAGPTAESGATPPAASGPASAERESLPTKPPVFTSEQDYLESESRLVQRAEAFLQATPPAPGPARWEWERELKRLARRLSQQPAVVFFAQAGAPPTRGGQAPNVLRMEVADEPVVDRFVLNVASDRTQDWEAAIANLELERQREHATALSEEVGEPGQTVSATSGLKPHFWMRPRAVFFVDDVSSVPTDLFMPVMKRLARAIERSDEVEANIDEPFGTDTDPARLWLSARAEVAPAAATTAPSPSTPKPATPAPATTAAPATNPAPKPAPAAAAAPAAPPVSLPGLLLVEKAGARAAKVGDTVKFTVRLEWHGPGALPNVNVMDAIDPRLHVASVPPGESGPEVLTGAGGRQWLCWRVGWLNPGDGRLLEFSATVTAPSM
jgi:cell division septation protein DedD